MHERTDVLTHTAMALIKEAEQLYMPFQFNPIVSLLEVHDVESLRVKTDKALVVTSSMQIHYLPRSDDDSGKDDCHQQSNDNSGDRRQLSPKSGVSPSTSRANAFLGALWGQQPGITVQP